MSWDIGRGMFSFPFFHNEEFFHGTGSHYIQVIFQLYLSRTGDGMGFWSDGHNVEER